MTRRTSPCQQRGAAGLIGLLIVLGLASAAVGGYALMIQRQYRITFAEIEGQALSQFAVGLRGFVAAAQADPTILPGNPWNTVGVTFLKPPGCGGLTRNPPEGFLPCNFTGQSLGSVYNTRVERNAASNSIEARVILMVPTLDGDPRTRILTAERVVEAALRQQSLPANGMFYEAFANVPVLANAPSGPVPVTMNIGRVVLVVNNAPSNDIWLRTDGTNQMRANLNFGGFSVRNARDGRFSGDLRVENRAQIDNDLIVSRGVTDMRGGAIVGDVSVANSNLYLDSIQRFAESGVYNVQMLTGAAFYTVMKPDCTRAGNSPAIYASLQSTGSINHDGIYRADAMYDARVDVLDWGTMWRIFPTVRGTRFNLQQSGATISMTRTLEGTNATDARIVVITRCR